MYIVKVEDRTFKLDLEREGNKFKVCLNSKPMEGTVVEIGNPSHLSLILGNKSYDIMIESGNTISVNGEIFKTKVETERLARLDSSRQAGLTQIEKKVIKKEALTVTAPMPGLVIEVEVNEGDKVNAGTGLVIVEAMKMQNELKAPRDGIVKQVLAKQGMSVNSGDTLVIIE